MLKGVESIISDTQRSLSWISEMLAVPYGSLSRWKERADEGRVVVAQPGPSYAPTINMSRLTEEIAEELEPCRKRVKGSGRILKRYKGKVSRRQLEDMIIDLRLKHVE